jgi:cyclopropane-fatty-acyl-phospholipid synthase
VSLFALEHSRAAYRADFALHGTAIAGLLAYLLIATPADHALRLAMVAIGGLLGWTAVEYVLHRYVLHGLPPFRDWHTLHHQRPLALIYAPTLFIACLFAVAVFLPAWWWMGTGGASALTVGLLGGYLAYAVTHHATHHWRGKGAWLAERRRWHALHHHGVRPGCYGVTTSFWDHVFGSTVPLRSSALPLPAPADVRTAA